MQAPGRRAAPPPPEWRDLRTYGEHQARRLLASHRDAGSSNPLQQPMTGGKHDDLAA